MEIKKLLLKTAFCCMACDGEIAEEEIALVRKLTKQSDLFVGLDVENELNRFVAEINEQGRSFLSNFIAEIADASLSEESELQVISIAFQTIEADESIEYAEISYFKRIRAKLRISDEKILQVFPGKEDYLLPDIQSREDFLAWPTAFELVSIKE